MKQLLDPQIGEDLARWAGRREAFAMAAGRCSAAEAESLRRMRDEKQYRKLGMNWEEFCAKRLGVSRRHIDRTLRLLDEFGPAYFHVAQMAHVTADEYRAIAPHISGDGVQLNGAVVALLPENSERVSSAVAELLQREKPAAPKPALSPDTAIKRCATAAESLSALDAPLADEHKAALAASLQTLARAAARRGVHLFRT